MTLIHYDYLDSLNTIDYDYLDYLNTIDYDYFDYLDTIDYDYWYYQTNYYSGHFTTSGPYLKWAIDETFYKVMRYRVSISTLLAVLSTIMNLSLLLFLFFYKEFRSWLFFPLMMQATVDIVGPGIAHLVFEWKLYFHWPVLAEYLDYFSYSEFSEPGILEEEPLQVLPGRFSCVLMHLRSLLNEYSTGYCLLATAMFRYLLVCHPNFKITTRFCKLVAVALVSIPCIAMFGSVIDLIFNDYGYEYIDDMSLYGEISDYSSM